MKTYKEGRISPIIWMHRDAEHTTFKFYVVHLMQAHTSHSAHVEFRRPFSDWLSASTLWDPGIELSLRPVQKTVYLLSYLDSER